MAGLEEVLLSLDWLARRHALSAGACRAKPYIQSKSTTSDVRKASQVKLQRWILLLFLRLLNSMATRAATPPVLQGPSAKEKKYDRQLRLWAANGQRALEEAHVLLLNTSPGVVGVEILKNLILPGIGNFTIVDDELVTEADLGVNFFLAEDSLGRSRAEESYKYLQELNPEVHGHAVQEVKFQTPHAT